MAISYRRITRMLAVSFGLIALAAGVNEAVLHWRILYRQQLIAQPCAPKTWLYRTVTRGLNMPGNTCVIALDLSGDGMNRYFHPNDVHFDIDNDGFSEAVEWLYPPDGFLARDLNRNGEIDDVTEMFGDDGDTNAYDKLARLDTNKDGEITRVDPAWKELVILRGRMQTNRIPGSIDSLDTHKITSISVRSEPADKLGDGAVVAVSSFVTDYRIHRSADLRLRVEQINSWYKPVKPMQLELLPYNWSRGYGTLMAMGYAAAQDPEFARMLEEFSQLDIKSEMATIYSKADRIQLRWSKADLIAAQSRGSHINAKYLHAIEMYLGKPFINFIGDRNPDQFATKLLWKSYSDFSYVLLERLLLNGPFKPIFPNYTYKARKDDSRLNDTLDTILLRAMEYAPPSSNQNHEVYWNEISRILSRYNRELKSTPDLLKFRVDQAAGFTTAPASLWPIDVHLNH